MSLPPPDPGYLAYHAPRYDFVLALARGAVADSASRVLDIGPSPLSGLLRDHLPCPVDTLGLQPSASGQDGAVHHHADLNDPASLPPDLPPYDLIVFAEVLEHLHTAPAPVLAALGRRLAPGGILILQTPNAAALPKRLKLLFGRNPYDLIRADPADPGHFREYTLGELRRCARQAGLVVVGQFRRFYFDARYADHHDGVVRVQPVLGALKNIAYRALPPFLREGITLVLRAGEHARSIPRTEVSAPPPR